MFFLHFYFFLITQSEEEIMNICYNNSCPKFDNKTYYCLKCRNTNLKGCFERKEDFCCGCLGYVLELFFHHSCLLVELIKSRLVCYACDAERNCPSTAIGQHAHFQCQNTFLFFTIIIVVILVIICIIIVLLVWRRLKYGKFGEPSFSHVRPCDDQSYGYGLFFSLNLSFIYILVINKEIFKIVLINFLIIHKDLPQQLHLLFPRQVLYILVPTPRFIIQLKKEIYTISIMVHCKTVFKIVYR